MDPNYVWAFCAGWFASWLLWRPVVELTTRLRRSWKSINVHIHHNVVRIR